MAGLYGTARHKAGLFAPASPVPHGGILDSACARRSAARQVGTQEWSFRSNKGMASCCCGQAGGLVSRIEQSLVLEQRAQDIEQAIADASQRPRVAVATPTQRGVAVTAVWMVLNGHPSPMKHRICQSIVTGIAADHDFGLTAAAGDRGDA